MDTAAEFCCLLGLEHEPFCYISSSFKLFQKHHCLKLAFLEPAQRSTLIFKICMALTAGLCYKNRATPYWT